MVKPAAYRSGLHLSRASQGHRLKNKESRLFTKLKDFRRVCALRAGREDGRRPGKGAHRGMLGFVGCGAVGRGVGCGLMKPTPTCSLTCVHVCACVRACRVGFRLLLTGTPLQNNLGELFALMHFLDPSKFSHEGAFVAQLDDLKEEQQVRPLRGTLCLRLFTLSPLMACCAACSGLGTCAAQVGLVPMLYEEYKSHPSPLAHTFQGPVHLLCLRCMPPFTPLAAHTGRAAKLAQQPF